METLPMPLDAMGAAGAAGATGAAGAERGGLDDFRVGSKREIALILKQLADGSVPLNLNASNGAVVGATVWTVDVERNSMGLSIDAHDPRTDGLLACQEAVVVGYIDHVKLQFDVDNLVLVRGVRSCVLNCSMPDELFRFQRRHAYRVRPVLRSAPVARMRHSAIADMQLALRVLDLSIGGCALFLPDDVPPMQPGSVLNRVQVDLDVDTRLQVNLRLQHVTSLNPDSHGVRLGCEFVAADAGTLRTLQRFIDQTQKRSKLLAI